MADGTGGKYNERRVQIIISSLAKMQSKIMASTAAGISYKTYQTWYNTIPEFKKRVDEVLEDVTLRGKTIAIQAIFAKMDTNWQAAAWWLERNFPNEFGRKDRMDMDIRESKVVFTIGNNDVKELEDKPDLTVIDYKKMKEIVAKGKKMVKENINIEQESLEIENEDFKEIDDPRFDGDEIKNNDE